MSCEKNVRIELKNGLDISIPRQTISKIVLPSVLIREKYFRLVIPVEKAYEENITDIKKRFRL
jgi:hypothetical protein